MPKQSNNRDLPEAITRLKLCIAFKPCGHVGVVDAFDKSDAGVLYVYDDNSLGYTDWTNITPAPEMESKCLKVTNPNNDTIVLLPLDGRILTGENSTRGGVCDGMVLTQKEMCLVEFKTNADSENFHTIIERANKGITQLSNTFEKVIKPNCATQNIDIEKMLSIEFYVVFDKSLNVTSAKAELMELQAQFLINNKHSLYFNNEKSF